MAKAKLLGLTLALAMAPAVGGCIGDNIQTGDEQYQTEINGLPAAEFYAQFLYERIEPLRHRYPTTWEAVLIPGSHRSVELDLYMRGDGSYTATYGELVSSASGGSVWELEEELSGSWRVSEGLLRIEGLGVADGLALDGQPALALTFGRDIETAGLDGLTVTLRMVTSSWGPDGNDP